MNRIELNAAREAAESFCAANLKTCCAELVEWSRTALLRDGKVRELANLCAVYMGEYDSLKLAERMVQNAACEFVATKEYWKGGSQ
jgi:hypothetical protein